MAARPTAAEAGGRAGRALQMVSSDREGTREAAGGLLRSVSAARDARARLDGARAFAAGKGSKRAPAADRRELRERLRALASLLRDVAAISAGAAVPLANADLDGALRELAAAWGGARGRRAFAAVELRHRGPGQGRSGGDARRLAPCGDRERLTSPPCQRRRTPPPPGAST